MGAVVASILLTWTFLLLGAQPLLLGGLVVGVAGLWLALRPRLLWLSILALVPFSIEIGGVFGHGHNLVFPTELLAPLTVLAVGVAVARAGKVTWTLSPLHGATLVYLMVLAASMFTTALELVTLKAILRTLTGVLGGYILTQLAVHRPSDLRRPAAIVLVSTLVLVIYGFYTQFIEGISIYQDIAHPFFGNHCIYAAFVAFPTAFLLAAMTQPIQGKTVLGFFLAIFALAILFSFVRGAWIGMIGLVFFLLSKQRAQFTLRMFAVLTFLGLLSLVAVLALELWPLLQDRWQTIFDIGYVANSNRIDRWMAALSMWISSPIFGVGYGTYPELYYDHIWNMKSTERELHMGAHNLYLELMAEVGLVGLASYLFLIFAFFVETRRIAARARENPYLKSVSLGLESMMLVYLIHAFVNNLGPSDEIDIAFWTTCGLAVAIRTSLDRQAQTPTHTRSP